MQIERSIAKLIKEELAKQHSKIIVIYGARQVGKTTLVENILKDSNKKILRVNGDRISTTSAFSSQGLNILESAIAGYDILFIDEAQKINEICINLKILYDNFKELKIIVTGSSALDLARGVKEPLTGRKYQYTLYPISFLELSKYNKKYELGLMLNEKMIFGSYPDVLNIKNYYEKTKYITQLTEDYLYKDILELENVKYHNKLRDLLKLLALQIGSEVSLHELANKTGLNHETVARYIDLLEKAFVIFSLRGFSRNHRKEVSKKPKIFFYDLGIRNAIIGIFQELNFRNDIGALWKNFLIVERLKRNEYKQHISLKYFWRTYSGAELDYIEEYDGKLFGYEFKWSKTAKIPSSWAENYKGEYGYVNKDNFVDFVI